MEETRNFLIAYRGREGSSPLISAIGGHPCIHVPCFEELDHYAAGTLTDPQGVVQWAKAALRGHAVSVDGKLLARPRPNAKLPGPTGFKWRIWGNPGGVQALLTRERVTLFHLFRRNFLELAASFYLSDVVVPAAERAGASLGGGGHLQFHLATLPAEEREALRTRLAALSFSIPSEALIESMELILQIKLMHFRRYIRRYALSGGPCHAILYEDFCADRVGLLRSVYRAIGVDVAEQPAITTGIYAKVTSGDLLGQVENLRTLKKDPKVRQLLRSYEHLIFKRHAYLPPASA